MLANNSYHFLQMMVDGFISEAQTVQMPIDLTALLLMSDDNLLIEHRQHLGRGGGLLTLHGIYGSLFFFSKQPYPKSPFLLLNRRTGSRGLHLLLFLAFRNNLGHFRRQLLMNIITFLYGIPDLQQQSFLLNKQLAEVLSFYLTAHLPHVQQHTVHFHPKLMIVFYVCGVPVCYRLAKQRHLGDMHVQIMHILAPLMQFCIPAFYLFPVVPF